MAHVSDLIAEDIELYLRTHENKSMLRFITCGSVDDGKSTLIGRMLYESKMLFEDQLAQLEVDSKKVVLRPVIWISHYWSTGLLRSASRG